jgi:hypothetical protein
MPGFGRSDARGFSITREIAGFETSTFSRPTTGLRQLAWLTLISLGPCSIEASVNKFYLETRTRNFIYRSRAKIPMLYEQIELPVRKKIAASLKLKLPIVEAEIRQREASPSVYDMLRIVLRHLDDAGLIGTVEDSRPYFAGVLDARWAQWEYRGYLSGRVGDTVLGLSFSMEHLTRPPEADPARVSSWSGSSLAGAEETLRGLLRREDPEPPNLKPDPSLIVPNSVRMRPAPIVPPVRYWERGPDGSITSNWVLRPTVETAVRNHGPFERLEFVARRLAQGVFSSLYDCFPDRLQPEFVHKMDLDPEFEYLREREDFPVVLGSPLYLASPD